MLRYLTENYNLEVNWSSVDILCLNLEDVNVLSLYSLTLSHFSRS